MSQDYKEKAGKKNGQMTKISLVALLVVLLLVIEMYEIINDPANMIVIGALGAFLLVSVYVEMLLIGKLTENRAKEQEEAFDNVYRSEKASYLLMRKYFDQMDRKMENLGDLSNIPYKELIAAQKALAKAQINRNKQNTNALLISNDRMMQRLTSMQNDLTDILANTNSIKNENADIPVQEIPSVFSEEDREKILDGNNNVLETQQKILHNIKQLETSLRNEILESANKVASIKSQQMSVPKSQMQISETEDQIAPLDIDQDLPEIEPELQPIADELPLSAMSEEPDLQSILGEPELQPVLENSILDKPELQPVLENSILDEPELQPVLENSILDEPELQPIMEDSFITDEPELTPLPENTFTDESDLQSVADTASIMGESELQPVSDSFTLDGPESQSATEESLESELELPPISGNSSESNLDRLLQQMQSDLPEPESTPVIEKSVQSAADEPELQPVAEEAVELPVSVDSELAPIPEDSDIQSLLDEPDLMPLMEEVQGLPQTNELSQTDSSDSESQAMISDNDLQSLIGEEKPQVTPIMQVESVNSEDAKADIKKEDLSSGQEITPDRLAAMVANLGNDISMDLDSLTSDEEKSSFMAETLDPMIQSSGQTTDSKSADDELEKIMKDMNIDNIPDDSLEDLDIDKILEIPLDNEKAGSSPSNQVMSSEEIAALIANTELLSEPEPVKNDNQMDLSDPGHVMSSDEIAALIANM